MLPLNADDFVALAYAGGGFRLDASQFELKELVRICHAAADGRAARIVIENASVLPIADLIQLAHASRGLASFEE